MYHLNFLSQHAIDPVLQLMFNKHAHKLHNLTKYLASSALRRIELLVKRTDLMVPSESEEGMNNTSPPCWLASHTMAKENMLKNLVKMQVEPLSSLHNFR